MFWKMVPAGRKPARITRTSAAAERAASAEPANARRDRPMSAANAKPRLAPTTASNVPAAPGSATPQPANASNAWRTATAAVARNAMPITNALFPRILVKMSPAQMEPVPAERVNVTMVFKN